MSEGRDPFPMSSQEAQKLASSVEGGVKDGSGWGTMKMKTQTRGPGRGSGEEDDTNASSSLTGTKQRKKGRADDGAAGGVMDMTYDDDDNEEQKRSNKESDDFLDTSLPDYRARQEYPSWLRAILKALDSIYHKLYGDKLPISEMLRTLCLATTLFFMIGGYWLLRSLKDTIMISICGVKYIPKAKILSVFVVLGVVSVYNKLLDSDIPKHKLFYLFGTFYFCLFSGIASLLFEELSSGKEPDPTRLLGWISYCGIESFGSVMVSLFWSFTNSNFSLESAKASYGVMVATAQVGSIIGPTMVNHFAASMGIAKVYLMGAVCMLLLQGTMYMYISIYGSSDSGVNAVSTKNKKAPPGILEGLHLFYKHNYVKGVFAISCLFMVEVTIVDYTMKVLATEYFKDKFPCEVGMPCWNINGTDEDHKEAISSLAASGLAEFMGFFGQATNTLSLVMSLFGTSAIIRYLGFRLTLLLFPSLCLCVIVFVRFHPTLYVVFGAMILLKAFSYALNNPTKEILYQPTSPAVKYKAKSWIDIFGARGSKALGSLVSNAFSDSATTLVAYGSLVGMCVASFLIWNATFMGRVFDQYTSTGYIVGGTEEDYAKANNENLDDDDPEDNIQMAIKQNDEEDTSCAIYEDDELGPEEEGQSEHDDDDDENYQSAKDDAGGDSKKTAVVLRV